MSGERADLMAFGPASMAAGAPFFAGNRVVVELAPIYPGNVTDDTPPVEWIDITSRYITAHWFEGSASGQESRWPVASADIDCYDLLDLVGDFIDPDPDTALAAGSFIRISMLDTVDEVWWPQFTGMIDTIVEVDRPGRRTWRITAFDVNYRAAGWGNPFTVGDIAVNTPIPDAFDFIAASGLDLPFAWDTPDTSHTVGEFALQGNLLVRLHQLCDSFGSRMWAYRDGTVRIRPWEDINSPVGTTISDLKDVGNPNSVFGTARWSGSNARSASVLHLIGLDGASTGQSATTSAFLLALNGRREDAPGWPKLDLLFNEAGVGTELVDGAAPRYARQLSLDRVDIDSAHNRHSTDWLPLLRGWGAGDGIRFVRSADELTVDCLVLGAEHRIDRFVEKPRWVASYFPKIMEVVP